MIKRIYFKGLNGIRAIAAIIVVVFHIDQFTPMFGMKSIGFHEHGWAGFGVTLFFVLSGFLITYLLLEEKEKKGTVSLKNFYVRRILRIWPLYYLMVLLTLIFAHIVPDIIFPKHLWSSLGLYGFLLANVAYTADLAITTLTPLWSVGVEEQFYAIWPLMVKNSSRIGVVLSAIIPIYLAVKFGVYYIHPQFYELVSLTRIDCMAIGGLGAVLLKRRSKLLAAVYHPFVQTLSWLLLLVSTFWKPIHIPLVSHEFHAVFFLVIILNVSTNGKTLVNLENAFFDFLGKISYGVYVYHMLVIYVLRTLPLSSYLSMYISVIMATVAVSYASYRLFESPILSIKDRYSAVLSQAGMVREPSGDVSAASPDVALDPAEE